jgi:hypothetical protein
MDCTASTESYPEFEDKRATRETRGTEKRDATLLGSLVIYFGDVPEAFGDSVHRKADKSITIKGKNLSSVFVPDPNTNFGYGDVRGTADAILLVFDGVQVVNGVIQSGGIIEVFVARGKSKDRIPLYNLLTDGELDEEMNQLRAAVTKSVTKAPKGE